MKSRILIICVFLTPAQEGKLYPTKTLQDDKDEKVGNNLETNDHFFVRIITS